MWRYVAQLGRGWHRLLPYWPFHSSNVLAASELFVELLSCQGRPAPKVQIRSPQSRFISGFLFQPCSPIELESA